MANHRVHFSHRLRALKVLVVVVPLVAISEPALAAKGGGGSGGSVSVSEYSQCQNGGAPSTSTDCSSGWGNGILNTSNSHYPEDGVTPQRLLLSVPDTRNHKLTIRYMARKGSANAHAYDSLATWNYTAVDAYACQGFSTAVAALCNGTPTSFNMVADPTSVPPAGPGISAVTSKHELPQANRQWQVLGGAVTASTVPSHDMAGASGTDDYASVTITFHANAAGNVLVLFGGHLAKGTPSGDPTSDRAWGTGFGSANISGGPYHIILDSVDGASIGSRDNQIMASAIIAGSPNFTVTKTASYNGQTLPQNGSVPPGGLVTYTITVTNTGTADGATTFKDNFDDRLSPSTPTSNPPGGTCNQLISGTDKYFSCTTSSLAAGGGQQVFTYTASMPTVFTSTDPTAGCPSGSYSVTNTVTLQSGSAASANVCVPASPLFRITKSASPTTTVPGGSVVYTVTVWNDGAAPGSTTFRDDFDDRITLPANPPAGCVLQTINNNKSYFCTTGTIAANGGHQDFTYTAKMPASFSATDTAGGPNCTTTPLPYEIDNTATLASTNAGPTNSASAYVCVTASAKFTIDKAASPTVVGPGGLVTYTLTVTNVGTAAGKATITDDYDDRMTNFVLPNNCTFNSPSVGKLTCTTSRLAVGASVTITYTANAPTSFTSASTPGGAHCSSSNPQQYELDNTATITDGPSDSAWVCENASPNFVPSKDATPNPANPGQTVTYTITVTNIGAANGSTTYVDDYDDRLSPTTPNGCSLITVNGNKEMSCTTHDLAALGGSQQFVYTAVMPNTFLGNPGGSGCSVRNPHQYPVTNTVVLANGASASKVVCVNASPDLHASKSVVSHTDSSGNETLTYTITYSNSGHAEATSATITDAIPSGTSYVSCTDGCATTGSPVTGVTWVVGPIAPLTGSGSVMLTVLVTATAQCQITNTAYIQFDQDPIVGSNSVVVNITPRPNPAGAHANGDGLGAQVLSSGLVGVNTAPISTAASSQTGPGGPQNANQTIASIEVPSGGAVLSTGILQTTSSSQVTGAPGEALQTSTAEVANVCVLKTLLGTCVVKADTVRAVASTTATGEWANYSNAGTTITGLTVSGLLGTKSIAVTDLSQTTTIDLSIVGLDGYVAVNEMSGPNGSPFAGLSNGSYVADLYETAIHVKLNAAVLSLGLQKAEVIVARARAHSDFPQTFLCTQGTNQSVSGHALIVGASVGNIVSLTQGFVKLAPLGGSESQDITDLAVPSDGSVAAATVANSSTDGSITATTSSSHSLAKVAGDNSHRLCVLQVPGTSTCVVSADVVESETQSTANSGGATSNDTGTELLNVSIMGGPPIAGTPPPNTTFAIPGIGFVVLNEQTCDGGGMTNTHTCTGAHHSGMTIRSVHIVISVLNNLLGDTPGTQVVVSEAHSDATFG